MDPLPDCPPASPPLDTADRYRPNTDWARLRIPIAVAVVALIVFFLWHCERQHHHRRSAGATAGGQRRDGVPKALLASFPVVRFDAVRAAVPEGKCWQDCSVCLSEFTDGDLVRLLSVCLHAFHPECIDSWLGSKKTCPVCRADLEAQPDDEALAAVQAVIGGGGGAAGDHVVSIRDEEEEQR